MNSAFQKVTLIRKLKWLCKRFMINMCSHKETLLMFCTTLSVIILCTKTGGKHPSITWQILNPPIVFGKDAELFCNASDVENCCANNTAWMRDFDVIVHHSASTDLSKYIPKQYSDGFSLVIKHFNEDDVNHQYTCLYDFFQYSDGLKLNASFMIYWPNKEELKINTTLSDNMIVAEIMFDRIYPSPECIFVVNGEITATNVTITAETQNGLFYKMKINLVSELHQITCINSVAIHCTIGGNDMIVMENSSFFCADTNTSSGVNVESTENTKSITITLSSILLLCIAVSTSVIIWRKEENIGIKTDVEGGDLQPTYSTLSCAINCWRPFTSISEVSERIQLLPKHLLSDTRILVIPVIPAQKLEKFMKVLCYAILNDESYTQKLSNDTRIDIARRNSKTKENLNIFICSMTMSKGHRIAESKRIMFRVILEFNTFVEALTKKKNNKGVRYGINNLKDGNDINVGNAKSSLCSSVYRGSNDIKHFKSSSTPPAQKMKDVRKIVMHACLHDHHYIQGLATNIGINLARYRSSISEVYYSTSFPISTPKISEFGIICPAQKEKDVIKMIHYFVLHDELYYQKLVTNTRINYAREQRSIIGDGISSYSSVPVFLNESTINMANVIKASSFLPSWGMKKRCRVVSLQN